MLGSPIPYCEAVHCAVGKMSTDLQAVLSFRREGLVGFPHSASFAAEVGKRTKARVARAGKKAKHGAQFAAWLSDHHRPFQSPLMVARIKVVWCGRAELELTPCDVAAKVRNLGFMIEASRSLTEFDGV